LGWGVVGWWLSAYFREFVVFVAFLLFIVFLWIMFLMLELAVLSIQSTLLNQTSKIYNDYVDAARVANEEFEVLKADPTTPTEFVNIPHP
jgi:hypothetical protein